MVDDKSVRTDEVLDLLIGLSVRRVTVLADNPAVPRGCLKEATASLESLTHGVHVEATLITQQTRVDDWVVEGIGRPERQVSTCGPFGLRLAIPSSE